MLAKFAEDDRIEQMNAQKRRMKQAEHKRAVEKLLEERRAQFAQDRVSLLSCDSDLFYPSQHASDDSLIILSGA